MKIKITIALIIFFTFGSTWSAQKVNAKISKQVGVFDAKCVSSYDGGIGLIFSDSENISCKIVSPSFPVGFSPCSNREEATNILEPEESSKSISTTSGSGSPFFSLDKGGATFIAACLTALISLFSLRVSVTAAKKQALLAGQLTDWTNISKEGREYKLKQLTSFYDPIYTLLAANKNIFDRIGPASLIRKEKKFDDDETAEVWDKLASEVIVPNNIRICEIIQENLHFMADDDSEDLYLEFVTHAHAYKIFNSSTYEAYSLFQFPKDLYSMVKKARNGVKSSLNILYAKK